MNRKGWLVGVGPKLHSEATLHPTLAEAFFELQMNLVRTREGFYPDGGSEGAWADRELDRAAEEASVHMLPGTPPHDFAVSLMGLTHWIKEED